MFLKLSLLLTNIEGFGYNITKYWSILEGGGASAHTAPFPPTIHPCMVTTYDTTCQIYSTLMCMVYNLHLLSWLIFCYFVNSEIWLGVTQLHGYHI